MSITRHFYIHLEGDATSRKEVAEWIRPALKPMEDSLVQWFPLELDLNDLDPTWQTDTLSIHSGFGADDCLISGEHYSNAPNRLGQLIATKWNLIVYLAINVEHNEDVTVWRYQGAAEPVLWEHFGDSRYDEAGTEIGWHRRTFVRDGVRLDPVEIKFE